MAMQPMGKRSIDATSSPKGNKGLSAMGVSYGQRLNVIDLNNTQVDKYQT